MAATAFKGALSLGTHIWSTANTLLHSCPPSCPAAPSSSLLLFALSCPRASCLSHDFYFPVSPVIHAPTTEIQEHWLVLFLWSSCAPFWISASPKSAKLVWDTFIQSTPSGFAFLMGPSLVWVVLSICYMLSFVPEFSCKWSELCLE